MRFTISNAAQHIERRIQQDHPRGDPVWARDNPEKFRAIVERDLIIMAVSVATIPNRAPLQPDSSSIWMYLNMLTDPEIRLLIEEATMDIADQRIASGVIEKIDPNAPVLVSLRIPTRQAV